MTGIRESIQKPYPGNFIELFEIDTIAIGGTDVLRWHAGADENRNPIVWQGQTYAYYPIEGEGFDVTTKGAQPRPRLRGSNVYGILSALVLSLDDLVGAKVTRRRTLAQFLDGQPDADPGQFLPDDIYYVEKKVSEIPTHIEWELSSVFDLEGVQLPTRVILTSHCPFDYRGPECSYTGTAYFDVNGNPVATLQQDVCSKQVGTGCKKRFGERGRLPFGGFPGARNFKA